MPSVTSKPPTSTPLNESPSEKEGKLLGAVAVILGLTMPSMKVPPKRKGNFGAGSCHGTRSPLNESPSEKEGKFWWPPWQPFGSVGPQ